MFLNVFIIRYYHRTHLKVFQREIQKNISFSGFVHFHPSENRLYLIAETGKALPVQNSDFTSERNYLERKFVDPSFYNDAPGVPLDILTASLNRRFLKGQALPRRWPRPERSPKSSLKYKSNSPPVTVFPALPPVRQNHSSPPS
ncbi:MAG: hypothetical protein L6W00_25275 [Lentisphaeria bacterium]|nr:MAG: hypothetical protein L6W00_25275 [Lentisphaeria bacterium]